MVRTLHTLLIPILLIACVCTLAACGPRAKSTRLTGGDLADMSTELAQKLTDSDWMKARSPDSPPIVITWDKVENLTSDLLSRSEQWSMMQHVRDSADLVRVGREKAFTLVIPAALKDEGQARGSFEPGTAAARAPTHRMDATLRSATRADGVHRTDVYLCDFRVTLLSSGELAWSDTVALKRAAAGLSFD